MFLLADAAAIPLADKCVQVVITSPPFYGLRRYPGQQERVWGGDVACEHRWEGQIALKKSGGLGASLSYTIHQFVSGQSSVCIDCGAWKGALGLESNPDCAMPAGQRCGQCYVCHLLLVFDEVKRVLRDDGTCWAEIEDSYWGGKGQSARRDPRLSERIAEGRTLQRTETRIEGIDRLPQDGKHSILKALDLIGIPWRFALAMQARRWYLRSAIVLIKSASMPESVAGVRWERHRIKVGNRGRGKERWRADSTPSYPQQDHDGAGFKSDVLWADCPGCPKCEKNDGLVLRRGSWRPTSAYSMLFMFAKTANYFADGTDVRTEQLPSSLARAQRPLGGFAKQEGADSNVNYINPNTEGATRERMLSGVGANARNWWIVPPEPLDLPHYAAFPVELPTRVIRASTSPKGGCAKCGAPVVRVVKRQSSTMNVRVRDAKKGILDRKSGPMWGATASDTEIDAYGDEEMGYAETIGWRPVCRCHRPIGDFSSDERPVTQYEPEMMPCLVLDPFMGSGSTALAASRLGRRWVGLELSEEYIAMSRKWLAEDERRVVEEEGGVVQRGLWGDGE